MIITSTSLAALRVGFQTSFQGGLAQAKPQWESVATRVPSTTKEERYGWLGKLPSMREWVGDRHITSISESDYTIRNKSFEMTIGVGRDDIEDDNIGVYAPLFEEMGRSVSAQPDEIVFALLKAGFATNCYDGQYFFDTDHPVLNADGAATSVANTDGGAGTAWFLLCTNRALKPLIFQERRKPQFVSKDRPDDDNVFDRKEYRYGVDSRSNAGFGFWQMAWGSKQTLDATHYEAARAGLSGMKGDFGRPLGLMPNLLVVPPSLEGAGRGLLQSQLVNGGETNKWAGTAELLVVPWLA
ncbi:MAG: Mu-like prophage major head subunit gpT family protein [Rhizobiales bacterium]|nr:Mu-like prophage major head subunit gpT family protein [Hyphomicrobiales bacterium]